MYVLKNIGPLKIKGSVVCKFMVGKKVPEIALKHWGDIGVEQLKKAKIIADELPEPKEPENPENPEKPEDPDTTEKPEDQEVETGDDDESVRQDKIGQQEDPEQGIHGTADDSEQGGDISSN